MKTLNFTAIAKIITITTILSMGILIILDAVKNGTTI